VAAAARAERINPRSARKIWHKYLETGTTHERPGSGCLSKLTPANKRLIVRTVHKNCRMPFAEVGNLVNSSAMLVRNVLRPHSYHRRVVKPKPYLKPKHKDGRLSWARENANRCGWDHVAWSDESYMYLGGSRNRVFITRRAGEKYKEDCLIPTFTQSPIRVMVWGCVMQDWKGPLITLEYPGGKGGSMTGARYIAQVLKGAWKPFHAAAVRDLGREVLFQQDGEPSHRAEVTQKWL
ncbi:hypothetical protein EXIGLDRAFT_579865, partial [Exidia glandulosa HHB12029]